MIKLVLLTGFLGAGKTTFLNHILNEFKEQKIGLIVNEFSETGVDGAIVQKNNSEMDMIELTNGSIFCACIKDKFVDSLIEISKKDLEYVFIEASGLADPASIASILESIVPYTTNKYEYCGSICLTDALYFTKYVKILPALKRQVEYSRAVIVNKIDLVAEEQIQEVEKTIRELNADTEIFRTTYGQVSLKEILQTKQEEQLDAKESSNTASTRPTTITVTTQEAISTEKLAQFLDAITPSTFRVKGFVKTMEGTKQVSAVGTVIQTEDWEINVSETNLVVISSVGIRIISEVLKAAERCFEEKINIKNS